MNGNRPHRQQAADVTVVKERNSESSLDLAHNIAWHFTDTLPQLVAHISWLYKQGSSRVALSPSPLLSLATLRKFSLRIGL
jgi:hypothetical protein